MVTCAHPSARPSDALEVLFLVWVVTVLSRAVVRIVDGKKGRCIAIAKDFPDVVRFARSGVWTWAGSSRGSLT
eukprot:1979325-Rhodomonas_salina.4